MPVCSGWLLHSPEPALSLSSWQTGAGEIRGHSVNREGCWRGGNVVLLWLGESVESVLGLCSNDKNKCVRN